MVKPALYWEKFNLETWATPVLFFDFWFFNTSRKSGRFNYHIKGFTFRIGSGLFGDDILDLTFTLNNDEYKRYLAQEWEPIKLHSGRLF